MPAVEIPWTNADLVGAALSVTLPPVTIRLGDTESQAESRLGLGNSMYSWLFLEVVIHQNFPQIP